MHQCTSVIPLMKLCRSTAPLFLFRFATAALAAAILPLGGCEKQAKPTGRRGAGGPAPVMVAKVERRVAPLTLDAVGSVEAIRTANIRAQITGLLLKIHFQEGQEVQAGDLLFEIDPRPFQTALRSAEAELQRVRAQLDNANTELERYQPLSTQGLISKEQFQTLKSNQQALEASLHVAEAAVETDRLQLEFCSIRAPLGGRTGALNVHEGDLIRASDPGTSLVVINQLNPIYVTFSVPQQHLATIAHYRNAGKLIVTASATGTTEAPVQGELTFIDNAIDASTGTLKLKATFQDDNHRLWPGQFAEIHLVLAAPEAVLVSSAAVQRDQNGAHVFVVQENQTAEFRTVKIERTTGADSVVAEGLKEGEMVVVDGQLRVIPGQKVEIKQPAAGDPKTPREKGKGKTK